MDPITLEMLSIYSGDPLDLYMIEGNEDSLILPVVVLDDIRKDPEIIRISMESMVFSNALISTKRVVLPIRKSWQNSAVVLIEMEKAIPHLTGFSIRSHVMKWSRNVPPKLRHCSILG